MVVGKFFLSRATTTRSVALIQGGGASQHSYAKKLTTAASTSIASTRRMTQEPLSMRKRFLGVQAAKSSMCKYENLVEESIKKMITNKDGTQGEDSKSISNEKLEQRFNEYKTVFEEAESCLSDLRETLFEVDDTQYREECSCAEGAVDNAFTMYVDLLEDLRRTNHEQLRAFNEIRKLNASNLKRLRKELDSIIAVAENRNLAAD